MTSNTRVPKAEITGVYGAVLKKIGRKMFGEVPEPLEVMWHNRPATVAWRPLRETEGSPSDGQEVRRGENGARSEEADKRGDRAQFDKGGRPGQWSARKSLVEQLDRKL